MLIKKLTLYLLLLILQAYSSGLRAQNNFQPGFCITNDNDTLFGQIDNRGDLRNGRICSFRADENSRAIEFSPGEIAAYRFDEGKFYISAEIVILDEAREVFMEYLVNGIISLYYYRGEKSDHYFIEDELGELTELTNRDITFEENGTTYSRKSRLYIGQLRSTFSDAPEMQPDIDRAQYNHKSLINLTSEYHQLVCPDEQCILYEKKPPAVRIGYGPVIGLTSSGIDFVYFPIYDEYAYQRSTDLLLGLRLFITLPRLNEKLSFLFQTEYNQSYFYGYKEDTRFPEAPLYQDLHIHLSTMKVLIGMQYTYPKGKIRPTLAAGPLFSFNLKSEFKHVNEQVSGDAVFTREFYEDPLITENYGAFVSLGADWNVTGMQHLTLELRYYFSKETIGTIVKRDGLTIAAGYFF